MKCVSLVLAGMAVAFLGNVSLGQEAAGIPDEIVKELDELVGTWTAEGKVGEEVQTGGFTCRWAQTEDKKKICLVGHFTYKTGDEVRSGITLIGWNAAKKCIEDRGFDANGGNDTLWWMMKSPTHWQGEVSVIEDGKEVKGKIDLVKKSPAEFVYEGELENGDVARVVFRKAEKQRKAKPKQ